MPTPITADCLAEIGNVSHGFFTREGGVSAGLYNSLNCGSGSKDAPESVSENRRRVAQALGAPDKRLLTCHQIHSAEAIVVTEPWEIGRNPKADGMVTKIPGILLGALAADCAPVLFADPEARVVGAAHAGWKGALTGVIEATIAAMEALGAHRRHIRAALGPCIGPAAYEVGAEFEARFLDVDSDNARFFRRQSGEQRPYFDLPGFVLDRLAAAGLDSVENCTRCTYADETNLFSYRRATHRGEPDYGRQVSAIVLL
jgi:YfiH family protein